MTCDRCGAEASNDSNFCGACGNALGNRKRNLFLLYRGLAVLELYLLVIFLVGGLGILYGNYKQDQVKPSPPRAQAPRPKIYRRVWWSWLSTDPEKYRGKLLEEGGIVSSMYPSKNGIGLLLNTVRISTHGGWTAPVYVLCDRSLFKDSEISVNDIVLVRGVGAGTRVVTVDAKPVEPPALKADMVEVSVKSGSQ